MKNVGLSLIISRAFSNETSTPRSIQPLSSQIVPLYNEHFFLKKKIIKALFSNNPPPPALKTYCSYG